MRKFFLVLTTSFISLLTSCINSAKSVSDVVNIRVPNDTIIKEAKKDSLILTKSTTGTGLLDPQSPNHGSHISHCSHRSHVSHFSRLD